MVRILAFLPSSGFDFFCLFLGFVWSSLPPTLSKYIQQRGQYQALMKTLKNLQIESAAKRLLSLLLLGFTFALGAEEVKITASIDQENLYENEPISGMISITHDERAKIDEKSFSLERKPLKTEFAQEVKISNESSLMLSFYRFSLPSQKKGLQMLPEVSVKVGGKEYSSFPTTYVVGKNSTVNPSSSSSRSQGKQQPVQQIDPPDNPKSIKAELKLEAWVDNPLLYPGQRTRVAYRYTYTDAIGLTEEKLPLLEAEGLLKIGTQKIQDTTKGEASIREISQEVQAIKPGVFTYGPSISTGYVYRENKQGEQTYQKEAPLKAITPAVSITVQAFPEQNKPASFNEALGIFKQFNVSLVSSPHVFVGDKLNLKIAVTGTGPMENVPLPALCCQPGFSGIFSPSDLPPAEEIKDHTKIFMTDLRPLSAQIKAIPPVEFSFFDPSIQTYASLTSQPIPITVTLPPQEKRQEISPSLSKQGAEGLIEPIPQNLNLKPIEISGGDLLTPSDLFNRPLGTLKVLCILPLGVLAILIQLNLKKIMRQYKMVLKSKDSAQLFQEAMQTEKGHPSFYALLNQAFLQRLVERGEIKSADISLDKLPRTGASAMVREFLLGVDERRFSGQPLIFDEAFVEAAHALFNHV